LALRAIRIAHTAAFFVIAGCIAVFDWEGMRRRPGRRATLAASIAVAETLIYVSNNQVCPLTPLAEELGAESGTVTDLYLPRAVSDRVPVIGGSALIIGLALNALARRERPSH
jgi:glucose dehydrogenase